MNPIINQRNIYKSIIQKLLNQNNNLEILDNQNIKKERYNDDYDLGVNRVEKINDSLENDIEQEEQMQMKLR